MATINLNGKDYDTDSLSETAKANLISLQFDTFWIIIPIPRTRFA